METLTNMTQAATKAIWGTPTTQEPVSGKTGDVAKGEPYDAGNIDPPEHVEDAYPATPQNEQPKQSSTLPTSSEVKKSMSATTTSHSTSNTTSATTKPNNEPSVNPTKHLPSSTVPGDASYHHTDVRSPSDPAANPESAHFQAKHNVDDTDGFDKSDNPEKLDGPGPRPVSEIAKENGGDAGRASRSRDREGGLAAGSTSSSESGLSMSKKDTEEDKEQKESDGPEEGKGLLYVRSSGLNADGGDFDATKPGAGREADRLLEEKGVHRDAAGGLSGELPESGSHKEKRSLKEKIKAKLHKAGPV